MAKILKNQGNQYYDFCDIGVESVKSNASQFHKFAKNIKNRYENILKSALKKKNKFYEKRKKYEKYVTKSKFHCYVRTQKREKKPLQTSVTSKFDLVFQHPNTQKLLKKTAKILHLKNFFFILLKIIYFI